LIIARVRTYNEPDERPNNDTQPREARRVSGGADLKWSGERHEKPERRLVKLPRADRAIVDPAKVRSYLLSASHPIGRFKAAFFRSLGYTDAQWSRLAADLCAVAVTGDAVLAESTAYGQKYEVRGRLIGPSGQDAIVVTVWIVLVHDDVPKLVTAYPRMDL
jgi:hypothetical protein